MFLINNVIPVFAIILLGAIMKRLNIVDDHYIQHSDFGLYYIFLPILIFWKIAKQSPDKSINWDLIEPTLVVVVGVFIASLLLAKLMRMDNRKIGAFSQSCYRFSTYLGLAIVAAIYGEEGMREFGILIGFLIPVINFMAVTSLIWYSGTAMPLVYQAKLTLKNIALNPLIIACVAGLLYSRLRLPMPPSLDNTLGLLSALALPLALLSIGASLNLALIQGHLRNSLAAAGVKLLIMPALGYLALTLTGVRGMSLVIGMIYFSLPASPTSYILSSQLNSDADLASSAFVVSTLLSLFSMSAVLVLFRG